MFRALSPLQRAFEGALDMPLKFVKNAAATSIMRYNKQGLTKRARGLVSDTIHPFTKQMNGNIGRAYQENKVFWQDWSNKMTSPNRGIIAKGFTALRAPLQVGTSAADFVVGAAADVLGAGAAVAGTAVGLGLGAVGKGIGQGFKYTGKGMMASMKGHKGTMFKYAHHAGASTVEGAAMVGLELGKVGYSNAFAAGKFLVNSRNNPVMGTALVAGAIGGGLLLGNQTYNSSARMGDLNGEVSSPFGNTPNVQSAVPQSIDDLGASGDLVFAMNRLRSTGVL